MKKITIEQMQAILNTVYQTNISAQTFDALKKMFNDLPAVKNQSVPADKKSTEEKPVKEEKKK